MLALPPPRHMPCDRCGGEGQVVSVPCTECKGDGRVRETRKLAVKIPAGIDDGATVGALAARRLATMAKAPR